MSPTVPTDFPNTVPTVPTSRLVVGTVQPTDSIDCPDRPNCPDHLHEERARKKRSLDGLVERLRRQEGGSCRFETRQEPTNRATHTNFFPPIHPEVGTVGTVGTVNDSKELDLACRSGQWSGHPPVRSGQCPPADELPTPPTAIEPSQSDPWAAGIARLQRMQPPLGFSVDAWKLVRLGCARLLCTHGDEMRRLGWSTEDAFGVHPHAPAPAIHCYGLGVLLNDSRVVVMTRGGATVELSGGIRHSFTRRPMPEAVPIWTL